MARTISRDETASRPVFVISVAAKLAGMHPQTLRQYDRLGLVVPSRTRGRGRRYSLDDIEALREVQHLSQVEGINLAGISEIMRLRRELRAARRELAQLQEEADARRAHRVFAATASGDVVVVPHGMRLAQVQAEASARQRAQRGALVLWQRH
ncbi:MAG: MerR family transcriptional regulator [Bowdeniella nasicola]|nr:MerR family transcriptional regulator [Bowdeniella nasicola]